MDIIVEITDFKKEVTERFAVCRAKHCQSRGSFQTVKCISLLLFIACVNFGVFLYE